MFRQPSHPPVYNDYRDHDDCDGGNCDDGDDDNNEADDGDDDGDVDGDE